MRHAHCGSGARTRERAWHVSGFRDHRIYRQTRSPSSRHGRAATLARSADVFMQPHGTVLLESLGSSPSDKWRSGPPRSFQVAVDAIDTERSSLPSIKPCSQFNPCSCRFVYTLLQGLSSSENACLLAAEGFRSLSKRRIRLTMTVIESSPRCIRCSSARLNLYLLTLERPSSDCL